MSLLEHKEIDFMQRILTGNIVLPEKVVYGNLVIEEDKIKSIEVLDSMRSGEDVIVPGFLDIHFHGTGPCGIVTLEDLKGIAAFEPRNGVTAFTPALASCDRKLRVDYLHFIRQMVAERASGSAVCAGAHLEGPWLSLEYKGGMAEEMLTLPSDEEVEEVIRESAGTLRLVTMAPELENGLNAIKKLTAAGCTVSIGHSAADAEAFTAAADAGLSHVCHLFDAYAPRPVIEGVTRYCLADACLMDDRVTIELICDGFHVPPELIKLAARLAGVDRIVAITDSMQGTGLPNASYIQEDGYPYYLDNESVCRSEVDNGIVGSCLPMKRAFTNLVNKWGFSLVDAAKMTSTNPAKVIGLKDVTGKLCEGFFADINILSAGTHELKECIVRGESCFKEA